MSVKAWREHKYKIEAGIPLPEMRRGRRRYPWRQLAVGESFMVYGDDKYRLMDSLTSCRAYAQMKTGWTFALRIMPSGVRVWRTA